MITVRESQQRGRVSIDWLDSLHSFSFGSYYDQKYMGFSTLRVINEDRVIPGAGFATHGHRDMEIITYVLKGAVEHQDSIGNQTIIKEGEIQRMSAGTGILHSEFNHSKQDSVHFLQIWILPQEKGLPPSYEQQKIDTQKAQNNLYLLVSPNQKDGSLLIHQDVNLYLSKLSPEKEISYQIQPTRSVWLQVTNGEVTVNNISLKTGDGAAITEESNLVIKALQETEILLFDLNAH